MAAPITLRAWRRHVWSPDPTPPPRRTLRQLTALTPSGRATYAKARIAWHGTDVLLTTRDIRALETMVRVATLVNAGHTAAARRGIAVSAPATLGKTTALLHLGRQHEMRTCHGEPSTDRAPVAYIATPAGATPKMIMTTFARFFGIH